MDRHQKPLYYFVCLFPAEKGPLQAMQRVSSVFYLKPPTFLSRRVSGALTWQLMISWTLSFSGKAMTKAEGHSSHHLPSPLGRHATYFLCLIFFSLWMRTLGEACLYTAGLVT